MKHLLLLTIVSCLIFQSFGQSQEPKLLIVGIDGFRPDALEAANTPNFDLLMSNGTYSYDALMETPTLSGAGWSSILTGVWKVKHRVTNNLFTSQNFDQYPHFFNRLEEADTSLKTASFAYWDDINNKIVDLVDYTYADPEDHNVTAELVNYLSNEDPDAVFVHLGNIDHEGHIYGFGDTIQEYLDEAEMNDSLLGVMMASINNRPNFANENWLYIVTTDHGGIGFVHSGPSDAERNIFMIVSGDSVPKIELKRDTVSEKVKTALSFDGVSNYAKATNASTFNFGSSQNFTIECRVKTSGFSGDPVIVGNKNWSFESSKGFAIATDFPNGPEWVVNLGDGFNFITIKGNPIDDNEWHHLSVTFDREGSVTLFENGTEINSIFISQINDIDNLLDLAIGQDGTLSYPYFFNGFISEVRIWDGLLSNETINDYACKPLDANHPRYDQLLSYWKMDEGFGTILNDAGPNSNGAEFFGNVVNWTIDNNFLYCYDYTETPTAVDVAITALDHFCIPINPAWELDGVSRIDGNCSYPTCDPVTDIASTSVTSSSVSLNWIPVPGADHYVIRGNKVGIPSFIYLTISNGAASSFSLSGLANNTSFQWQIQAICDPEGQVFSEFSELDTFTTFTCVAPASIFVDSITATSVELNWTTNPNAVGYEIVGKPIGFPNYVFLYVPGGTSQSFEVSGLLPSISYQWAMRSHCGGASYSAYTAFSTFSTLAFKKGQSMVQNYDDFSIASNQIDIYPNPFNQSTVIEFKNDDNALYDLKILDISGKIVRFTPGIDGSSYTINRNELPNGMYFIELRGERILKAKIIIE